MDGDLRYCKWEHFLFTMSENYCGTLHYYTAFTVKLLPYSTLGSIRTMSGLRQSEIRSQTITECCLLFVVYLTLLLTDPLRIQPWS